jgi:hypothetical protein
MKQDLFKRSAARLQLVVVGLLAIAAAAFAIDRLGIDFGPWLQIRRHGAGAQVAAAPEWALDLSILLFLIALAQLARMLGRLKRGEVFTAGVTTAFRSFAAWLLASAVVAVAAPLIAAVTTTAPGGSGRIPMLIDIRQLSYVIAALVLFLIARMLDEAARIEAELREIV